MLKQASLSVTKACHKEIESVIFCSTYTFLRRVRAKVNENEPDLKDLTCNSTEHKPIKRRQT